MKMPGQGFKIEVAVCIVLIGVVLAAWLGFAVAYHRSLAERAAFWFMRDHLQLGESSEFVLNIARDGLPQPLGILMARPAFQASVAVAIILVAGQAWLALRLSKLDRRN